MPESRFVQDRLLGVLDSLVGRTVLIGLTLISPIVVGVILDLGTHVTVLILILACQVGEALNLTPFHWGLITMGKDRVLILERPDFFVGQLLGEKASPALISAEAVKVLG